MENIVDIFAEEVETKEERRKRKKREISKKWRENNKNITRKYDREYGLKNRYGITVDDYNKMLKEQNCCCDICGRHKLEFKTRLAVDHCHKTGKIRGLLCYRCNTNLGIIEDEEFSKRAKKYLKNFEK